MSVQQIASYFVGLLVFVQNPEARDQKGLSQSAENAILLAGAVAVASAVIGAITVFVKAHMPK